MLRRLLRQHQLDLYVAGVVVGGLIALWVSVAATSSRGLVGEHPGVFLVFCVLLASAEFRPMPSLTSSSKITASWTFAFTLVFLAPLGGGLVVVAVTAFAADLLGARSGLMRSAFNSAQFTLSLAIAALTGNHLSNLLSVAKGEPVRIGWLLAVTVSFFVGFVLNSALVSIAIALDQGLPAREIFRRSIDINLGMDGLLLALAPVFVVVALNALLLLPFLLLTVWAIFHSASIALENRHEATHDQLTNVPNRRMFEDYATLLLEQAAKVENRGALVEIDLDGFKAINDRLGHHFGDRVLIEVANRLTEACRPVDHMARLGGDEFAVLLGQVTSRMEAEAIARRLLGAIAQPMEIDGVPLAVGASIGVAMYPDDGADLATLLSNADAAMYGAKASDSAVRMFTPTSSSPALGRQSLLSDLSRALDDSELHLLYQPIVEIHEGDINRVECLVRWDHPVHGPIAPSLFISEAEHTELMGPLTDVVLRAALAQCAAWHDESLMVGLAVNVSAQNLREVRFPNRVADLLDEHGIDPRWLEIEITENAMMQDTVRSASVLAHLREIGVSLAIDDFGTGYSSLASLKQVTVDRVKVDRSFVTGLADNAGDLAITRSVIELARNLGLGSVAEGIETPEVLAIVRELGCNEFQGFLASMPVPAEDLTPLLATGRVSLDGVVQPPAEPALRR